MICSMCNGSIEADSRYCRHCGSAQAGDGNPGHPALLRRDEAGAGAISSSPRRTSPALWVAGGAGLLLLIAIASGSGNQSNTAAAVAPAELAGQPAASAPNPTPSPATAEPASDNWTYSTDEDKVRGATTYYAVTSSTNTVAQDPPYDSETRMTVTVRKSPAYGTDVLLRITSGQMMCPSYEGCTGTVRFDDGPARAIRFMGPADNSSDTVFVQQPASFIAKLKNAKRFVIEKTLYQAGNPQFEFDVSGLKWKH